jgi:hypothetical protein
LLAKYAVDLNPVAGCVVTSNLVSHVRGYNRISMAYLRKKFGSDIFEACAEEARRQSEEAEHAYEPISEAPPAGTNRGPR